MEGIGDAEHEKREKGRRWRLAVARRGEDNACLIPLPHLSSRQLRKTNKEEAHTFEGSRHHFCDDEGCRPSTSMATATPSGC